MNCQIDLAQTQTRQYLLIYSRPQVHMRCCLEATGIHNASPYRNLGVINRGLSGSNTDNTLTGSVRVEDQLGKPRGLNQLATLHAGAFGHDPVFGSVPANTYVTVPSWHKTNRNRKRRIASSSAGFFTQEVFDNLFIHHAIPRSTQQYSWVTSSLASGEIIYGNDRPSCFSASVLDKLIVGEPPPPATS